MYCFVVLFDMFMKFAHFALCSSMTDCKKHQEEKQAKARELREKLLSDKAERLHLLARKVTDCLIVVQLVGNWGILVTLCALFGSKK